MKNDFKLFYFVLKRLNLLPIIINFFSMNLKYLFIICFLVAALSSCKTQTEKDKDIILDYISENNLSANKHESGLYYVILNEGTGEAPDLNSNVTVYYEGYLTDGNVFDKTEVGDSVTFPLNRLIQGWQIGIPLIKKGGKEILLIPSELGYGDRSLANIPAN